MRWTSAVTTGNSYTVATAVEGTLRGAEVMGIEPGRRPSRSWARPARSGASARICWPTACERIVLIGRRRDGLDEVARELAGSSEAWRSPSAPRSRSRRRRPVITVTSALDAVIEPEMLRPGAVVCDVARPRDVSVRVARERDDVLVIEGGAVAVPGENVRLQLRLRLPARHRLRVHGRDDDPGAGGARGGLLPRQAAEPSSGCGRSPTLADKHGFGLAGFRSFERTVTTRPSRESRARAIEHEGIARDFRVAADGRVQTDERADDQRAGAGWTSWQAMREGGERPFRAHRLRPHALCAGADRALRGA
jgi:fatty aldehyde-generating acyl-ACP reductase